MTLVKVAAACSLLSARRSLCHTGSGIDVHKKVLTVVVSNVEVESEFQFERRMFGSNPQQLRASSCVVARARGRGSGYGIDGAILEASVGNARRVFGSRSARSKKERIYSDEEWEVEDYLAEGTVRSEPSPHQKQGRIQGISTFLAGCFLPQPIIDADSDNADPMVFSLNRELTGNFWLSVGGVDSSEP